MQTDDLPQPELALRPVQQRAEQPPATPEREAEAVRTGRHGRLVTAARRVNPAGLPAPVRLLDAFDPPRGAWRRRDRWSVVAGSTVDLRVRPGDGDDRFAEVRDRAAEAAAPRERRRSDGRGALVRPRLYGGFAFHAVPRPGGPWSGFPAARFTVPTREVRVGPDGAWLLAVADAREAGPEDAEATARGELRALEQAVSRLREEPRVDDVPAPAPGAASGRDPAAAGAAGSGDRDRWRTGVERALRRIRDGRLEKVVLARTLRVPAGAAVDPARAYRRLRDDNPRSTLFYVQPERGSVFLGASPELLGAARGSVFRATAVAGSLPRGDTDGEDRALGRRLLESDKDRREQAIVSEEIRRCLAARLRAVSVSRPRLLKLSRIQHLESSVEGRLPDAGPGSHLLDLLAELHPTPAVCGRPRDEALRVLRQAEGFERGWYAGPVGWFDASGQGEFVPGLRSAVLRGDRWHLFAGAGIVEGSDPDREWRETGAKFVPMFRALGSGDPG